MLDLLNDQEPYRLITQVMLIDIIDFVKPTFVISEQAMWVG